MLVEDGCCRPNLNAACAALSTEARARSSSLADCRPLKQSMPPKNATSINSIWHKARKAAVPRAGEINVVGSGGWLPTTTLREMLKSHVGQMPPEKMGRDPMIKECIKLRLAPEGQLNAPAPRYLTIDDLRKILGDDAKDLKSRDKLLEFAIENGKIPATARDVPFTRPDRAEAMKKARQMTQVSRTGLGLRHVLRGCESRDAIETRIMHISDALTRLAFFGSRRLDLHLRNILDLGGSLPDFSSTDAIATHVRHVWAVTGTRMQFMGVVKSDAKKTAKTVDVEVDTTAPSKSQVQAAERAATAEAALAAAPFFNGEDKVPHLKGSLVGLGNVFKHAANVAAGGIRVHWTNVDKVSARIRTFVRCFVFDAFMHRQPEINKDEDDVLDDEIASLHLANAGVREKLQGSVLSSMEQGTDISQDGPARAALHALRKALDIPIGTAMTELWLKQNVHNSIRFTWHVMRMIDQCRARVQAERERLASLGWTADKIDKAVRLPCKKGVSLVPLAKLGGRRFATIDATDLPTILGDKGMVSIRRNIDGIMGNQFKASTGKFQFTGCIDTDGVSCHMHFETPKPKKDDVDEDAAEKKPTKRPKDQPIPKVMVAVDTGRVNLAKVSIFVDGKVVWSKTQSPRPWSRDRRKRPMTMGMTCRHHRQASGIRSNVKSSTFENQKETAAHETLRGDLSSLTSRSSNTSTVRTFFEKQSQLAGIRWGDSTLRRVFSRKGVRPNNTPVDERDAGRKHHTLLPLWHIVALRRMRVRQRTDRPMTKFWVDVKRAAEDQVSKGSSGVLVWGVNVKSTGKGNLPAPTCRIFKIASSIFAKSTGTRVKWTIERGDEFRTSMMSCINSESELASVRVTSTPHPTTKDRVVNVIDGHSKETADEKKTKKEARAGKPASYVRGLRFCPETSKFVDRDVNGAINIGLLWLCDRVMDWVFRPSMFVNTKSSDAKTAAEVTEDVMMERERPRRRRGVSHQS